MARPRKPTKILELSGAFKSNPQRKRKNEPKPKGKIGDPPEYFNDEQVKIWYELISIIPDGVLADADRFCLEITVRLMHEYRTDPDIMATKITLLMNNLGRMGLTPSDRSKVAIADKEKKEDPWGKFG